MERLLLFQKNWNETEAKGIDITNIGTKWNIYFHSSKKLERNQRSRNFYYHYRNKMERLLLFLQNFKQTKVKKFV
jgi:hypothetical protein